MPQDRRLLIVIADGEHARFVRPGPDNALHTDTAFDSSAAHHRSGDLRSDRPGAAYHSDSTAHSAETPRHDPHVLEKERFARFVAAQLDSPAARNSFDELVIAAPPHCLSTIRKELDAATGAKVVGTIGKDLTKTPDDKLRPHLSEWVGPTRRAGT